MVTPSQLLAIQCHNLVRATQMRIWLVLAWTTVQAISKGWQINRLQTGNVIIVLTMFLALNGTYRTKRARRVSSLAAQ